MGLLDFFGKRQKLSTVLPQIPFNGQVAIQQGIITWQGGDNISFVNDGYSANDIVYSIVKLIGKRTRVRTFPFGISPGIHAGKERTNLAASRSKEAPTPLSMITFETEPSFSTTKET